MNFPGELPIGSSLEIDVEADMLNLSQALEEQKKYYHVLAMNKEELEEARKNIRAFRSGKEE